MKYDTENYIYKNGKELEILEVQEITHTHTSPYNGKTMEISYNMYLVENSNGICSTCDKTEKMYIGKDCLVENDTSEFVGVS